MPVASSQVNNKTVRPNLVARLNSNNRYTRTLVLKIVVEKSERKQIKVRIGRIEGKPKNNWVRGDREDGD